MQCWRTSRVRCCCIRRCCTSAALDYRRHSSTAACWSVRRSSVNRPSVLPCDWVSPSSEWVAVDYHKRCWRLASRRASLAVGSLVDRLHAALPCKQWRFCLYTGASACVPLLLHAFASDSMWRHHLVSRRLYDGWITWLVARKTGRAHSFGASFACKCRVRATIVWRWKRFVRIRVVTYSSSGSGHSTGTSSSWRRSVAAAAAVVFAAAAVTAVQAAARCCITRDVT